MVGHEYSPQPSAFEAALTMIRSLESGGAGQGINAIEEYDRPPIPAIDGSLLPSGHPHKTSASTFLMKTRRLGTLSHSPGAIPTALNQPALHKEGERRRLLQLSEMKDEVERRMLGGDESASGIGGSTTNPVAVVTNGVNAPSVTSDPSSAAIGSDFFRFGSVTLPTFMNWTMTRVATDVHFEGSVSTDTYGLLVSKHSRDSRVTPFSVLTSQL